MCYGTLQHECSHICKTRVNCRKTWRQRSGWFCYPMVAYVFGPGPEKPCEEMRDDKHMKSHVSCPKCTEAEQAGTQSRGRLYDRCANKLTPEELRRTRRRKEDEKRQKELERNMYLDERLQAQNRRRSAGSDDNNNNSNNNNSNNNNSNNNKSSRGNEDSLPSMPTFTHVPLGEQWGHPMYHYPQQVAVKFPPAPPPDTALPEVPQVGNQEQTEVIDMVLMNEPTDENHRQDRHDGSYSAKHGFHRPRRVGGYGGFANPDSTCSIYGPEKQADDGRNPYRPYTSTELATRTLTKPKINPTEPPSSFSPPSTTPNQPGQSPETNDPPRHDATLAHRRGRNKPADLKNLSSSSSLARVSSSKKSPAKSNSKYCEKPARPNTYLHNLTKAARPMVPQPRPGSTQSDTSSFVCQDARAVERERPAWPFPTRMQGGEVGDVGE